MTHTLSRADEHELATRIAHTLRLYCRCMPATSSLTRGADIPYSQQQVLSVVLGAMDEFFAEREDAAALRAGHEEAADLRYRLSIEDAAGGSEAA